MKRDQRRWHFAANRKIYSLAGLTFGAAAVLSACGGGDSTPVITPAAVAPVDPLSFLLTGYTPPVVPAAKTAIVAPEFTGFCPITTSSIDSMVTRGKGVAFNGATFGSVGTYTYILAEATGKVSAKDPCAATIVDLKNSGDANGVVTYKFDVIILTPTDATKSNGTLLYEVHNRTSTPSFGALMDSGGSNLFDSTKPVVPAAATGVVTGTGSGNGFLMSQGTTIVWSGWQGDRPSTLNVASAAISATQKWYGPGMTLPVAKDPTTGARITGTVQDEFIADSAGTTLIGGTYYPRVSGTAATLTIRKTPTSAPIEVNSSYWTYTAGSGTAEGGNGTANGFGFVTIDRTKVVADPALAAALDAGVDNGSIYHFNYTAGDPKPMGLGFLGIRDLVTYLRYGTKDTAGNANPVAGLVKVTLGTGISQSGRVIRDFLWQGFNAADKRLLANGGSSPAVTQSYAFDIFTGKRVLADVPFSPVFDGLLPLVGGSRRTYTNYRWAKPGDYSRQHEQHYTPGDQFPFAFNTITDPLTGKVDGLLKKCLEFNTCPKVYHYDSPIEFGGARASLVNVDLAGKDLTPPANVRLIYAPGTSHGPSQLANNANSQPDYTVDRSISATGASTSPGALVASTALYRALLVNLEGFVRGTATPVANSWPSVVAGTMAVPTTAPASLGSPDLSAIGLGFNGVLNTLSVNDESVIPSKPSTQLYTVYLPTTDAQGNERAGIKMPDIDVPLATFKGYNIRRSGFVAGDQNGLSSSQLAFALTTATKKAGDPRKSVAELYPTKAAYLAAWNASVDALAAKGLLLPDDVAAYKNRGVMQTLQANFATLP